MLVLAVLLLVLNPGGTEAQTCNAVTSLHNTTVICLFEKDIGKSKDNFNVKFFYPDITSEPETVLACNRKRDGGLVCNKAEDVDFNETEKIGHFFTFKRPPSVEQLGGKYLCQVIPQLTSTLHYCRLTYEDVQPSETETRGDEEVLGDCAIHMSLLIALTVLWGFVILVVTGGWLLLHVKRERVAKWLTKQYTERLWRKATRESAETDTESSEATAIPSGVPRFCYKLGKRDAEEANRGQTPQAKSSGKGGPELTIKDGSKYSLLIVGKSGSGKTRLANTIIGARNFSEDPSKKLPKRGAQNHVAEGQRLKVIKTADLQQVNDAQQRQQIDGWKNLASPHPVIVLLFVCCENIDIYDTKNDDVSTTEEYDIYEDIKRLWGDDSPFWNNKVIVVFTFNGRMDFSTERIEKCRRLSDVVQAAGNWFIKVNNKAPDATYTEYVKELLTLIDKKGEEGDTLRIVMLGDSGTGKSSLGNTLLGKDDLNTKRDDQTHPIPPGAERDPEPGFEVGDRTGSKTASVDWDRAVRFGSVVEVTDTPGLCRTDLDINRIYKEVAKCVAVAVPGPNVIIFAIDCGRPPRQEEIQAYRKIQDLFSAEMSKHLIIVFNFLDCYGGENKPAEPRKALDEEIKKTQEGSKADTLKELIELADKDGFRWFGMVNTASRAEREKQATDLIRMMQDLVRKNGRDKYVKTQMTEQITETVEELAKKEAADKEVSLKEATARIKRRIIEDKVPETFTKAVTGFVRDADKGIHFIMKTPGTKKTNICSVM